MRSALGQRSYAISRQEESWYDCSGGVNPRAMPQEMADDELTAGQNGYLSAEGGFQSRKGIAKRGVTLGAFPILGAFRFFQQVVDGAPIAIARTLLAQANNTLWNYDTNSTLAGANALGAGGLPWSVTRAFDANRVMRLPAAPTNQAPVAGGALAAGTYLVSITYVNALGETLNSPDLTVAAVPLNDKFTVNSPAASQNATGYNVYVSTTNGATGTETKQNVAPVAIGSGFVVSTIIAGAARPTTNTAISPSDVLVICTGVGGPYLWDGFSITTPTGWAGVAGARWCQQVNGVIWFSGLPSQQNGVQASVEGQIEVLNPGGFFSMSQPVTGLGSIGAGVQSALVVGMNQGLSVIGGVGINNFYQNEVPHQDGVAAGRTMVTINGILYFLGESAIYMFDGYAITPVSGNVQPWILNDPLAVTTNDFPMSATRGNSWAFWYLNRLHIVYPSPGLLNPNTVLVLNMDVNPTPGRGWTPLTLAMPLMCGCLINAPGDPDPATMFMGNAVSGQGYNWDVNNGTGDNVDDDGTPIQINCQSKFFKLGKPGVPKVLYNFEPEVFTEAFSGIFTAYTDYGASSSAAGASGLNGAGAIFDTSRFDSGAVFAAAVLNFFKPRIDTNGPNPSGIPGQSTSGIMAEAVSFGVSTGVIQPPFRFAGVTSEFTILPRR
jgi:hypothetical protein